MKINEKNYCQVCNEEKFIEVKKNNFFLRTDSSNKELIDFKNLICYNCGTIYHHLKIDEEKLIHHYENQYKIQWHNIFRPKDYRFTYKIWWT